MIEGTFREAPGDRHIELRAALLEPRGQSLPEPPVFAGRDARDGAEILDRAARVALDRDGVLVLQLTEPLSNGAFMALGRQLGALIPETDPTVMPYVDDTALLNLITAYPASTDVSVQPFAANALTLHSESSGRAAERQPRYIALMCCDPGDDGSVMATVLSPMDAVALRLPVETQAVLAALRYRNGEPPPILRTIDRRSVFSFRDFCSDALDWRYSGNLADTAVIAAALRALLSSMYDDRTGLAVAWRPGLLLILDNRRYFHGRCAARDVKAVRRRHLKRLRIA